MKIKKLNKLQIFRLKTFKSNNLDEINLNFDLDQN